MAAQRGFDRLVNLSDAVVAIAATLLILPLVDIVADSGDQSTLDLLTSHWDSLLAFVLSFAVICRFWIVHHSLFNHLDGFTVPMVWVNFLWMLSIAFLPFPTELLAFSGPDKQTVSALYIGTMVVTSAATTGINWIAIRNPQLQTPDVRGTLRIEPGLVTVGTLAIAFVIALIFPEFGLWSILLLFPAGSIGSRLFPKREPAATA